MLTQLLNTANPQQTYLNLANLTVIYEESFSSWQEQTTFDQVKSNNLNPSALGVILHSIPLSSISLDTVENVVTQIKQTASWLYLTDITERDEYYHSFTSFFEDFVSLVDL
jgi:hypothetical protein